jgi:hypothetical protein
VTNDPASGVFGQFDPARMQQIVATFGTIPQRSGSISDIPDPASLYDRLGRRLPNTVTNM